MFFKLINVSAIFQVYINKTLRDFINVVYVVYLNDILIYNNESTQHWRNVRKMLKRLRNYQLYVNLKKCRFVIIEIEFLNFVMFTKKMRMNEKRVRIIKKWFKSTIFRKFQMFLNFVNFYRKFIYRYLKIIEFLINLFKSNKIKKKSNFFKWFELTKLIYRHFRDIFIFTSLFCHYNSKKNAIKNWCFQFCFCRYFQLTKWRWKLTFDDVHVAQNDFDKTKLWNSWLKIINYRSNF